MALLVILFFRDMIAGGASNLVGVFGTEDINVQSDPDAAPSSTDAGQ